MSYKYTLIVKFRYKTDKHNNDYAVIYDSIKGLLLDEGFVETNTTSEFFKYYECQDEYKITEKIKEKIRELLINKEIRVSTVLGSFITVDEQKVIKENNKAHRIIYILKNNLDWTPCSAQKAYAYFKKNNS